MKASALLAAILVAFTSTFLRAATDQSGAPKANAEALILQDFKDRINKYLDLRKHAAKDAPPLKPTTDPAQITAAQTALADQIRAARADAKAGDIFTPEIRDKFRRLLYPELKGEDGRDVKQILKDDAP